MKSVYIIVDETDRSNGAFSTPEKAAAWCYSDELKKSGNGTIENERTGEIKTLKEVAADMLDPSSDYPVIDELKIDNDNTKLIDS